MLPSPRNYIAAGGKVSRKRMTEWAKGGNFFLDFVDMVINHNDQIKPIQRRDKMDKYFMPDFPLLFERIGDFLRGAKVPKSQKKKLEDARRAFDTIAKTLYSRQAKAYPCTGGVRRISPMPLAKGYPCITRARISPMPFLRVDPRLLSKPEIRRTPLSRVKK